MTNRFTSIGAAACMAFCVATESATAQIVEPLDIRIVRDAHGIPHIKAPTAVKAFHGLGYITASDRLFQMEFYRRSMRGTMAEVFPISTHPGAKKNDIRARTLGFGRYADQLAGTPGNHALDNTTYDILEAYAAGVNKRIAEHRASGNWPFMFQQLQELHMADWTVADCILCWMYQAEGTVHWGDYNFSGPALNEKADPSGAVLPDAGNGLFAALLRMPNGWLLAGTYWCVDYAWRTDFTQRATPRSPVVKASHNFVVHGSQTATGKPLLLAKPQHQVTTPSTHYEFALKGGAYDFRGAGFVGSPGVLHGWNRYLAWSVTGAGADDCDVYKVAFTDPSQTSYVVRDEQGGLIVENVTDDVQEVIQVKGGANVVLRHARTRWGPLVTARIEEENGSASLPANVGYSVQSQLFVDAVNGHASVTGSLELMRASSRQEMIDATKEWHHPSAHMLVALPDGIAGQTRGTIGYRPLGAIPMRPHTPPGNTPFGKEILNGNREAHAWQGTIPFDQIPAYLGTRAFLSTANNLAADPLVVPQAYAIGMLGDTTRSWRLRERGEQLVAGPPLAMSDLEDLDHDMVDPSLRAMLSLARDMQAKQQAGGSLHGGPVLGLRALQFLADTAAFGDPAPNGSGTTNWNMDAVQHSAYFSHLVSLGGKLSKLRKLENGVNTYKRLERFYGSRRVGVLRLLKDADADSNFYSNIDAVKGRELEFWVNDMLRAAQEDKDNPLHQTATFALVHQWNLKPLMNNPGNDPAGSGNWPNVNAPVTGLKAMHYGSVWSQEGEAYKFVADVSNPDNNKSLLAPGASENPSSPYYSNNIPDWKVGTMHAAPITWGLFQENNPIHLSY